MENTYYIQLFEKFIRKQASLDEIKLLIEWLKQEDLFEDWLDKEWNEASTDMDMKLKQRLLNQIKEKTGQDKHVPLKRKNQNIRKVFTYTLRIASAILLLLVSGWGVHHYTMDQMIMPDMVVSVEKGQKANIVLPDGSNVWVNSDTRLSYGSRFNRKERVLFLKGEAYFEVARDEKRPFIVKTNDLAVEALGTSFNIKSYDEEDHISTILMSGKIRVSTSQDHVLLNPSEKITYDKQTGVMTKTAVENPKEYVNWKYNTLTFHGETFENIVHTLERYYNTRIVFESESLKKYRFTGTPGNTSLESILHIFSLTSPLSYEVRDSVIILRENMEQKAYYEKALK